MILADSSVWIAHLRDQRTRATAALAAAVASGVLLVGDLILLEVLQGANSERHAALLERSMRQFDMVQLLDPQLASQAARNFRLLRARGITMRKTADVIIGTYCIAHGHVLLHHDRDFRPMSDHLNLKTLPHPEHYHAEST